MSQIFEEQMYSLKGHYDFDQIIQFLNCYFKKSLQLGFIAERYLKYFS
jgi:hypothetical protein